MLKILQNCSSETNIEANILAELNSRVKKSTIHGEISSYVPTLTFLSGPSIGKEIPLLHRQLTLGRGNDCDIVIADPAVSRKHLQITCRRILKNSESIKIKAVLKDLDSKNGTLVNYSFVKRIILKPGDKIILGRIILKYEHRDLAEKQFFDEIYRFATVDSMTSLHNKSTIIKILEDEIAVNLRDQQWLSVVRIDIDKFKSINDIYGHQKGDRVLRTVADLILYSVKQKDKVGRIGDDEFLIVLPKTDSNEAVGIAERIRRCFEATVSRDLGLKDKVTASFGVASCPVPDADSEQMLEHADAALNRSKSLGRNRVELWKTSGTSYFKTLYGNVKKEDREFLSR